MTDKELILNYVGLEEWDDNQKISYLSTATAFQTNPIKIKHDKYGYRIDPSIKMVAKTLKEMIEDKELIKSLKDERR